MQTELTNLITADKVDIDNRYSSVAVHTSSILYTNNGMDACVQISIDAPLTINGFTAPRVHVKLENFYVTKVVPSL